MSKWQPIETAPRDGTVILATWEDTWKNGRPHIEPCDFSEGYWYYSYDGEGPTSAPTHWAPLPELPETTEGATNG